MAIFSCIRVCGNARRADSCSEPLGSASASSGSRWWFDLRLWRSSVGRCLHLIADADFPVFEDVGAEAAAVYGLSKQGSRGISVDDRARFAESQAVELRGADPEVVADEGVEVDAAGDEVAAVFIRSEWWIERFAHLGFYERQRAAGQT